MKSNRNLRWRLSCAGAVLLSILTFTPLVMPIGAHEPELFGFPRMLWAALIVYVGFMLLILAGTLVHPGTQTEEDQ